MKLWIFAVLMLVFTACSNQGNPAPVLTPSTVTVDPAVKPAVSSIPDPVGGPARPVSALTDSSRITADFVQNELIVFTDNQTALDAFLARWNGKVVQKFTPDASGLTGIKPSYLVQVDPSKADTSQLIGQLKQLNAKARGDFKFSDAEGFKLLAAAAQENLGGLMVILNFVPKSGSVASGQTNETNVGATLSNADFANNVVTENWNPGATKWSYMQRGGPQDINVADAWRALAATNKLGNKVSLAIFDGGMLTSTDLPPGAIWLSPSGSPNPAKCEGTGGSFDCPWHGTGTIAAAMALPDNGFGVAGPAGPVAKPILVPSPGDVWSGIKFFLVDVPVVLALKPKIINFSFTVRIPEGINWVLNPPLDLLFTAVRNIWGTLVFAAAGNKGADVDETDAIGAFKIATWIPCQISKVVCVGSMGLGKTNISTFTNWANTSSKIDHTNTVDIFGPGIIWVQKAVGGSVLNEAVQDQGTSISSPFVAGVAALIWAANPGLSPNEVENILLSTAHAQSNNLVIRYVNAFAAVKKALNVTNFPPIVSVNAEPDLFNSRLVKFTASVSDIEDDPNCCTVSWASSVDGAIGSGKVLSYTFATGGPRKITATTTDNQGASSTTSVDVNITTQAPTVNITAPDTSQTIYAGLNLPLTGTAGEGGDNLCANGSGASFLWSSSNASDVIGNATVCSTTIRFVGAGSRTLSFKATDKFSVSAQKTLLVNAVAPTGLVVSITLPGNGNSFNLGDTLTVEGNISGGVSPYTHRWLWKRSGCADYVVPTKLPSVFPIPKPPVYELWDTSTGSFCTPSGTLTLEVTDSANTVATASVNISINPPPN